MEDILQQILNSGPVGIVSAAIVYLVITLQRNSTKKQRDTAHDDLNTRITLLENDNKMLHTQLDTIGNKLDKIIDQLCEIKVELAKKEDKD